MLAPRTLAVLGAGSMGAGIAQLGCAAGMRTLLYDPAPDALAKGAERVRAGLSKWAEKGRADPGAAALLEPVTAMEQLAPCELAIEAAPERADLKRELFARLSELCVPDAVLASNTSSIPLTSLARAAARPENVLGMHFFNPPPLMELLELIRAEQTGERAFELARATGAAMGKRVILASDGPGFLVNRCGRPFTGEALRLVQEGVASPAQVDRICRLGGAFRMGPFELMDLVGIDVNLEVARSFDDLSFGEPRWRPHPLQARMVHAGRLGRKSGRGWYDYAEDPYREPDPEGPPPQPGGPPSATLVGDGPGADELRARASRAGVCGGGAEIVLCDHASLAAQGRHEAVGICVVPPLERARLAELTRLPGATDEACRAAEALCAEIGLHHEWVGDAPGLVLRRIVACLVNEAAFAVGERVGSATDVDAGLTLGLNHPRGPVEWGGLIGLDGVLGTIDGLWSERHEERYRAAPLLRRAAALGTGLG